MRRRLVLRLTPLVLLIFGWLASAAAPQQGAPGTAPAKGGVGSITGPYEVPDPKWPEWAHPYPTPGHI